MYWPEIDEETGAMEGTEIIDGKRYQAVDATNGCVGCIFNGADGFNSGAARGGFQAGSGGAGYGDQQFNDDEIPF